MTNGQGQPSLRRTIEQVRAQQAWEAIENMRGNNQRDSYGSRAKNLPSMIQVNGLGATLAFLRAKAGTERTSADYRLYEHLARRIVDYLEYTAGDVMHLIREADTSTYRRATAEAIAFGIWLKRYVEAEGWKASN